MKLQFGTILFLRVLQAYQLDTYAEPLGIGDFLSGKVGCDTQVSTVLPADSELYVGGSTNNKKFIAGVGADWATGCTDKYVPFVLKQVNTGNPQISSIQWIRTFTDGGKYTYKDVTQLKFIVSENSQYVYSTDNIFAQLQPENDAIADELMVMISKDGYIYSKTKKFQFPFQTTVDNALITTEGNEYLYETSSIFGLRMGQNKFQLMRQDLYDSARRSTLGFKDGSDTHETQFHSSFKSIREPTAMMLKWGIIYVGGDAQLSNGNYCSVIVKFTRLLQYEGGQHLSCGNGSPTKDYYFGVEKIQSSAKDDDENIFAISVIRSLESGEFYPGQDSFRIYVFKKDFDKHQGCTSQINPIRVIPSNDMQRFKCQSFAVVQHKGQLILHLAMQRYIKNQDDSQFSQRTVSQNFLSIFQSNDLTNLKCEAADSTKIDVSQIEIKESNYDSFCKSDDTTEQDQVSCKINEVRFAGVTEQGQMDFIVGTQSNLRITKPQYQEKEVQISVTTDSGATEQRTVKQWIANEDSNIKLQKGTYIQGTVTNKGKMIREATNVQIMGWPWINVNAPGTIYTSVSKWMMTTTLDLGLTNCPDSYYRPDQYNIFENKKCDTSVTDKCIIHRDALNDQVFYLPHIPFQNKNNQLSTILNCFDVRYKASSTMDTFTEISTETTQLKSHPHRNAGYYQFKVDIDGQPETKDFEFYIFYTTQNSNWLQYSLLTNKKVVVKFADPPCIGEEVQPSAESYEVVVFYDPQENYVFNWKYTTQRAGKDDKEYTESLVKPPTFDAQIERAERGCMIKKIEYFRDSGLINAYSSTKVRTFEIDNTATPPTVKVTMIRSQAYNEEVYFKASAENGKFSSTKIIFRSCGFERVTAQDVYLEFNQYEESSKDEVYAQKVLVSSFKDKVAIDFQQSSEKCVLDISKVTLWRDRYCRMIEITQDKPDSKNYIQSFLHDKIPHILIKTDRNYYNEIYYLKFVTLGNKNACLKLTTKINEAQNPCKQIILNDKKTQQVFQDIKSSYQIGSAQQMIDVSSLEVKNSDELRCIVRNKKLVTMLADGTFSDLTDKEKVFISFEDKSITINPDKIDKSGIFEFYMFVDIHDKNFAKFKISIEIKPKPVVEVPKLPELAPPPQVQEGDEPKEQEIEKDEVEDEPQLEEKEKDQEEQEEEEKDEEAPQIEEEAIVEDDPIEEKPQTEDEVLDEAVPEKSSDGSVSIAPFKPPWLKLASAKDMKALIPTRNNKPPLIEEEIEPFKIQNSVMTRDGTLEINFNHKMIVPKFDKQKKGRMLIGIQDFDVGKVIQIQFSSNGGNSAGDNRFILTLNDWQPQQMQLGLNFSNPLKISQGEIRDNIAITILNRNYFISEVTGEKIEQSAGGFKTSVPRQLPKGIVEQEIVDDAKSASQSMTVVLIIQLVLQASMKGSLDDIWSLYLMLQLIAYISVYETNIPANVEIYFTEFRKMVNFEILQPDNLIGIFWPGVTLQSLIDSRKTKLSSSSESTGVKSDSILVNLAVYLFALVVFIVVLIILFILKRKKNLKEKIEPKIKKIIKSTFWNNIIRSITISYIQTAVVFSVKIQALRFSNASSQEYLAAIPMLIYLLIYPAICAYTLVKNRKTLNTEEMKNKIGKMYVNISLHRSQWGILYYPVFMFRRFLFIMIPLIFQGYPFYQLQFLIFFSSVYIIQYCQIWPHSIKSQAILEVYNEFLLMLINYHMICFSQFNLEEMQRFNMGWSFLALLALIMISNISFVIFGQIKKYRTKKRLSNIRKSKIEMLRVKGLIDKNYKQRLAKMNQLKSPNLNDKSFSSDEEEDGSDNDLESSNKITLKKTKTVRENSLSVIQEDPEDELQREILELIDGIDLSLADELQNDLKNLDITILQTKNKQKDQPSLGDLYRKLPQSKSKPSKKVGFEEPKKKSEKEVMREKLIKRQIQQNILEYNIRRSIKRVIKYG